MYRGTLRKPGRGAMGILRRDGVNLGQIATAWCSICDYSWKDHADSSIYSQGFAAWMPCGIMLAGSEAH